ncbi:MAG: hypothetical protein M5U29_03115 [Anaerolineae bacterium]|nr:hypothetical protein [Anaerolineae bacterium]
MSTGTRYGSPIGRNDRSISDVNQSSVHAARAIVIWMVPRGDRGKRDRANVDFPACSAVRQTSDVFSRPIYVKTSSDTHQLDTSEMVRHRAAEKT